MSLQTNIVDLLGSEGAEDRRRHEVDLLTSLLMMDWMAAARIEDISEAFDVMTSTHRYRRAGALDHIVGHSDEGIPLLAT